MGLNTVELVMVIESTFDIRIPIEAGERIVTVGDLYRFIQSEQSKDVEHAKAKMPIAA